MNQKKESKDSRRYQLYCEMIRQLDESCQLIAAYDAIPHDYGTVTLYQAESQLIHLVGENPGITAMKLATILNETPSACSQLIRKLRRKRWMEQVRNQQNGRKYQLYLTESGWNIFREHNQFEQACYLRSFKNLDEFTENDFQTLFVFQNAVIGFHIFIIDDIAKCRCKCFLKLVRFCKTKTVRQNALCIGIYQQNFLALLCQAYA